MKTRRIEGNKKQNVGPGGRGGLKNEISSMAGLGGRGAEVKETHTLWGVGNKICVCIYIYIYIYTGPGPPKKNSLKKA